MLEYRSTFYSLGYVEAHLSLSTVFCHGRFELSNLYSASQNVYTNDDPSVDIKRFLKILVNPNAIDEMSEQNESTSGSPTETQSVSGQNASLPENFTALNLVGLNSSPLVDTS